MTTPTTFVPEDCLKYHPFQDDFGEPGDRWLSNRISRARKPGQCHLCGQQIAAGEYTRRLCAIFSSQLESYRWCEACCIAMAASWSDDGAALEDRARLRT